MTADFSHLSKAGPTQGSRPFVFHELTFCGPPTLQVRCTSETLNPGYFNASSKHRRRWAKIIDANSPVTAEMLADIRNMDRALYPHHVVTGWADMVDASGQPVAYSTEECAAFLQALPDHIFDRLRNFSSDVSNFTEVGYDAEGLAGN